MDKEELVSHFRRMVAEDPGKSEAVAAIQTLIQFIKLNPAETLVELRETLKDAIATLTKAGHERVMSIYSGCEVFFRFITLTVMDSPDFEICKRIMLERGDQYLRTAESARGNIARKAVPFIRDGAAVLTHSRSRVVLDVLKEAAQKGQRFTVYVTESKPDDAGYKMKSDLVELGIPTVVILDAAVGYIMEKVDLVLVGAEGVVANGGIINKIGTLNLGVQAKTMNKPFYVVAESFKFDRRFPLNQQNLPHEFQFPASRENSDVDLTDEHPTVDYTPPDYINLLFTDLGILPPSAVSEEHIKLYL